MEMFVSLLLAGVDALKDYIALHVVTCLIPAFLLAGAIITFVSREAIIGYLGSAAPLLTISGKDTISTKSLGYFLKPFSRYILFKNTFNNRGSTGIW